MKHALSTLACSAALAAAACDVCDGDDALNGSFTLGSQSDLDELEGARCVFGDLDITAGNGDDRPVDDLSPLSSLEVVEGDLRIESTSALRDVSGLESLVWVGRRAFDPAPQGESIRGRLFVRSNLALVDVEFPALTDVGGCIFVENNPQLDAGDVDDFFNDVKTHGSFACTDGAEVNEGNNG